MSGRRGEEKTQVIPRGIFLVPAGFVVFLDQLTKAIAQTFLHPGESVPVLGPWFHLTLIENTGIAFGFFPDAEKILLVVILLSIGILTAIGFRSGSARPTVQWGVGLILGGAVGNLIDRLRVGAVIDFLDFRVWPVFNFADTAITIGVGLFLIEYFQAHYRRVS